jgi:hypothetical protein
MKKTLFVIGMILLMASGQALAHQIDYIAASISPPGTFNGSSGNFSLNESVAGNATISFSLKFAIVSQGNTTNFPKTITFGVPGGSTSPAVYFGADGTSTTLVKTFANASDSITSTVRIIAPANDDDYTVKISAILGTGGQGGLSPGGGISISFTVYNPPPPPPPPACNKYSTSVSLTLVPACIVLHSSSNTTFSATLTSGGSPLAGKSIDFTVDDIPAGSASTDANGLATISYNPSALSLGDHTVKAIFQGDGCDYIGSSQTATLGIIYDFLGFQPPVQISGNGVGLFSGKVIPVKIMVADALGELVSDAKAFVYFKQTAADVSVVGTEAESVSAADSGNQMRYDPLTGQYIFNWDTSRIDNGYYNIYIYIEGQGSCAEPNFATVNLQKSVKKR